MTLRQLDPVVLDGDLADWVEATAANAGLSVPEYLAGLVEADRSASAVDRANRLAAPLYQRWVDTGRPVDDGLTIDEVFGP
ncbi:hypothetical protein ACFWXO_05400 [Kitasatospora sp. NPDC059088]|uniref:hypothetical protein n=1 Tax=Kitasatospora sp. NPDC059088 TaxID=3346722 RepID=UPI0036BC7823